MAAKKPAVKKTAPKTVKSEPKVAKKTTLASSATVKPEPKTNGVSASVVDIAGKADGTITLPQEIFSAKVNPQLMAQAVRVYLANQRQGNAVTQTRGEVTASTRKIYRQKGTGRARHGALSAPIFVKGGVAHGPKNHDFSLSLSKKMKKAALFSALTQKLHDGEVKLISGLEKLEPKTKLMADVFAKLELSDAKRKVLFVLPKAADSDKEQNAHRAGRNLKGVTLVSADRINTYEVLNSKTVLFSKNAIESLTNHFLGKGAK